MPITTPASTPADSTATIAATATQKSNRVTRYSRRSSPTSIIPKTTASMIIAASTGLGSSEKSGARTSSVQDERTGDERRHRGPSPRPTRSASWPRGSSTRACPGRRRPDVRHALRHRLLIDSIAYLAAWRTCGRPGGLREPDQQQRERRHRDRRDVLADQVEARQFRRRQPARYVADERDAVRLEVEDVRRDDPRGDEDERPRKAGRRKRRPRISPTASTPTTSVEPCTSPSEPIHEPSSATRCPRRSRSR